MGRCPEICGDGGAIESTQPWNFAIGNLLKMVIPPCPFRSLSLSPSLPPSLHLPLSLAPSHLPPSHPPSLPPSIPPSLGRSLATLQDLHDLLKMRRLRPRQATCAAEAGNCHTPVYTSLTRASRKPSWFQRLSEVPVERLKNLSSALQTGDLQQPYLCRLVTLMVATGNNIDQLITRQFAYEFKQIGFKRTYSWLSKAS